MWSETAVPSACSGNIATFIRPNGNQSVHDNQTTRISLFIGQDYANLSTTQLPIIQWLTVDPPWWQFVTAFYPR